MKTFERVNCPIEGCPVAAYNSDDIAIHLVERHRFEYGDAVNWLRDEVEEEHHKLIPCQCDECRYWDEEAQNGNYKAVP